jgi:penicillin-binding protein 1C
MLLRLRTIPLLWRMLLLAGGLFFGLTLYIFYDLPSIDALSWHLNQPSIKIVDRNGLPLYEILPVDGGRHAVLAFENIPQCMKDATIAVEDKNFYQNPGVDPGGILRAFWINLRGGETLSGGSTITQQVARTLLFSQEERTERTLRRKLREAVLAWQLTQRYSKDEILALYLNQTYYGGMAYGIEAASQTYFGKPAAELLLAECALLAGLPQTPGLYNPLVNPHLALERQKVVLELMEKSGRITNEQFLESETMPLSYNAEPYPIEAPHFIWVVRDQLDALFLNGTVSAKQSLVITTTLDLNIQHLAEEMITRRIEGFKTRDGGISHNVNNAALVVLDPRSGDILAMVGSADYFDPAINGAINMSTSRRQTGSAFKPVIYASALDPGLPAPLTAGSTLLDISTNFKTNDGSPYLPVNFDGLEHGYVSVRESLASSLNVPAVLTLAHVGIPHVLELAHKLGIDSLSSPQDYDLSLALGGGEMSLLELSTAYAAFANEGKFTDNFSILKISDADGNLVYTTQRSTPIQVIDPRVAWLINDILSDDAARETGFGTNSILRIDRPAAVKTGTTTNFHDNWTIGYTPDLLVGVWVGNSNYESMRNVTGLTGAGPIWHEMMRSILEGRRVLSFIQPGGMEQVEICNLSGQLATAECSHVRKEWYIEGTQPDAPDTFYKQIWIDSWTDRMANELTPPERRTSMVVFDLPLVAQAWARSKGMPLLADYSAPAEAELPQLILISPADNTTYQIDPAFNESAQQISLEAFAQGVAEVSFYADGIRVGTSTDSPHQAWWALSEGVHHFWAEGLSEDGEVIKSIEVTIEVIK